MDNNLTKRHDAKSLLLFAMPTIIMMVFMSLYTMVDGIFVANFVSPDALAGLNLVIPSLSVLCSLAVLISAGGSVVISRKLGEGKNTEAQKSTIISLPSFRLFSKLSTLKCIIFSASFL